MRNKKPNKRILILCEGLTEYLYAKSLQKTLPRSRQRAISIDIHHDSKNDPKRLIIEAKKRRANANRERNSYDKIWLFFDNDNWPQLEYAFNVIEEEEFCIAYSSMCIEHWFLLHFENCGRGFIDGAEALSYLKTKWPGYHKTKINHYDYLKDNLDDAITRARVLRRNSQNGTPKHLRNPYFTIDKLIEFFNEFEEGSN